MLKSDSISQRDLRLLQSTAEETGQNALAAQAKAKLSEATELQQVLCEWKKKGVYNEDNLVASKSETTPAKRD
jgi:hypothetical protein